MQMRQHVGRLDLDLAFCLALLIGSAACLVCLSFYREKASRFFRLPTSWTDQFTVPLETFGGFSYRQLALVSLLGLFLELLMIRWISSEVRIFAYLKNFILVSCFLGFGMGCYLSKKKINLVAFLLPLFSLVLIIRFPWAPFRDLISALPSYLGVASEVNSMGIPAVNFSWLALLALAAAIAITVPMFILNALIFVPLGQLVGRYLEIAPKGIVAYSVNVLASLAGILLFTILCLLAQPPTVWFAIAGLLLTILVIRTGRLRWASILSFAALVVFVGWRAPGAPAQYWSPYQLLSLVPRTQNGELISYQLDTNHTWFQQVVNLSPEFVAAHPQFFTTVPIQWDAYNLPYHFYTKPPAVLVLGAGMGNDVAAALRNGAGHVTAVEIDPLILNLGRKMHFEHPYSSPNVTVINDDARSYVQNSRERFDLIVYSLLDSHTSISNFSAVRIDNYVYTLEAIQAARRLLNNDGLLLLKFQVHTPWIAGRLYSLLTSTFGRPPVTFYADASEYSTGGSFFVTGSETRLQQALADPQLAEYIRSHNQVAMAQAHLTTDDWPFFYQHEPGIPLIIILMAAILVFLTWFLLRRTGLAGRSIHWHFFFLGAGFLLLEAQIVSRMAMLFGTTWLVNSIVIAAVLVLIVIGNSIVDWLPEFPVPIAYAGIAACIAIGYFIPVHELLLRALWMRAIVATLVLCSPVAFAAIIFIRSFANAHFNSEALGSNLLGALVGGMLEGLSLWTGIRSLLLVAAVLYLLSYVYGPARVRETEPAYASSR
jgi:spermidine synthase